MNLEVSTPISLGELLDKISILEIKAEQIGEAARLRNVRHELTLLIEVRNTSLGALSGELAALAAELKVVNRKIWDAEDVIHGHDKDDLSDAEFLRHARIAFEQNDVRARLKRRINDLTGSALVEEKSYHDFGSDAGRSPAGGD